MAATVNNRPTSSKATSLQYGMEYMLETTIDFSVTANNLAQNETMALLDIPADVLVKRCLVEVITEEADITDINVSISADGSTETSIIADALDISSTGYKQNATLMYVAPSTSATQLIVKNIDANTMDAAKLRFIIICQDVDAQASTFATS
jgi:hypothetical protein